MKCLLIAVVVWTAPAAIARPTLNQENDFENGQIAGWTNGGRAPNPANIATGGPAGSGDNFLRVASAGGFGAGSRLVTLNEDVRWVGNFAAAGISAVTMDLKNFGAAPLTMRIAFEESGGAWYVTATGITLPADNAWHPARFDLTAPGLTRVSGSTLLPAALTRVSEFRILHSPSPDYRGAPISSSFGVDNIRAVPEPATVAIAGLLLPLLAGRRRFI